MPSLKPTKKQLIIVLPIIIFILILIVSVQRATAPDGANSGTNRSDSKNSSSRNFDKSKYSLNDPNSIWVVVNKKRPLPDNYTPQDLQSGLRSQANNKLQKLLADAANNGTPLYAISAFRSQAEQAATYNSFVSRDGVANADTYSARPGHSEHQTGLAVDLGNGSCDLEICFSETPASKWLETNAHKYGFIIRYKKGSEGITGYQYEPWHLRFVGNELASELKKTGQTMEEFFDLPVAPAY